MSLSRCWRKSYDAATRGNPLFCHNYKNSFVKSTPTLHYSVPPSARSTYSGNAANLVHRFRIEQVPRVLCQFKSCTHLNSGYRIRLNIGRSSLNCFLPVHYSSSASKQDNKEPTSTSVSKSIPQLFVDSSPTSIQPFLKISRVHKPIGTWLLFWPCTWGLALGAGGLPELSLLTMFGVGAFIMRGAGCTVNDMWDRHIDKQVRRTADRPLASGEMRMRHATAWLALQLTFALSILVQLNSPCFIIGVGSLALVTIYPLCKRITNWPQAVLGLTFNIGTIIGFTAVQSNQLGYLTFPWLDPSVLSLYLAGISWTLVYDTIYAHQDIEDDTTLGLGSTARRFGENTKNWLSGFSCVTISSLTAAGILADLNWPYYAGVAAVASHLAWQIKTLDIHNTQNCSDRFTANRHIGWMIFLSILGSSLVENSKEKNPKLAPIMESLTSKSILSGDDESSGASILSPRSTLV